MRSKQLDDVFGALSDATRRGMLEQLSRGETNVSALAEPHAISQPAISRHLRVLEHAGLIRRKREGREHRITVDPRPIDEARGWLAIYSKIWKQQFDAVDVYLEERARDLAQTRTEKKTKKKTPAKKKAKRNRK